MSKFKLSFKTHKKIFVGATIIGTALVGIASYAAVNHTSIANPFIAKQVSSFSDLNDFRFAEPNDKGAYSHTNHIMYYSDGDITCHVLMDVVTVEDMPGNSVEEVVNQKIIPTIQKFEDITVTAKRTDDLMFQSENDPNKWYAIPTMVTQDAQGSYLQYDSIAIMPKYQPRGDGAHEPWRLHIKRGCEDAHKTAQGQYIHQKLPANTMDKMDQQVSKLKIYTDDKLCKQWYSPCKSDQDRAQDRDTKRIMDVMSIATALRTYHDRNNTYPSDLDELLQKYSDPDYGSIHSYLSIVPQDPLSTSPYTYMYTHSGATFSVKACLEESKNNTSDKIIKPVAPCTTRTFEETEISR